MATLSGVRVNLFNENFLNETEQDANSVLTELDKGLRSAKLGIQCEAIVRFPRLFEKYPFPILINSSFLKLAEFFWNGSNLLRFWVLRVCQQSENHLDKILNIDQFVKRIFMVIHSNDPIARALTLRTLGAVSRVIPEKQQVHHAIRRALDSHDTVEVEAAIFASSQFAAQSKTFAISMCAKISDMIESLNIPVNMKLLLIPVLQHMHHDANTAAMVKSLCLDLLPKYPAEAFVIAILDSLTKLSSKTLIGVPDQVELLIYYLQDVRKSVRMQTLNSLFTLANSQCVHAWPKSAIGNLIAKAKDCPDGQPGRKDQSDAPEQNLYLNILYQLSACPLTCHIFIKEQYESILELCTECIWTENYRNCSQSLEILAALAVYCHSLSNEKSKEITELVNLQIESCLFLTIYETKYAREFKRILGCGIKLSSVDLNFGTEFVTTVAEFLDDKIEFPACNVEQLCGTLGALCSTFQLRKFTYIKFDPNAMDVDEPEHKKINPVLERLHTVLDKLNAILDSDITSEKIKIVEILSAVTLQTLIGCFIPKEIIDCFERSCPKTNCWTQYRIARSASRYGQHFLAARIFSKISQSTSLDKLHFYLMGLSQMAQAECILNYGLKYDFMLEHYIECNPRIIDDNPDIKPMSTMQRLESAINLYWQALASMRASSSPTNPLTFQLEYLKLRAQFLQTLLSAVVVKNAQVIVPPPAIAGSLAQNSRDYLQKFGHVTNQLRKLVKSLKSCEESYSKLYKSAFDSDPATLEFLEIMEYQCALFASIVETICYATPSEPPTFLMKGQYPETKYFILSCKKMEELLDYLPQEPANAKTICNRHLEVIISEIELIISRPLCMPRYFFQVLQSTQIKLSVSPQPRSAGEPVIVQSGSNLVIKVEGVIQHFGKKHSQFRRVDAVQLSLTSQLVTPRPAIETGGKPTNDTVTLTQTVKPQRDFLSGSFLLPISNGGQWQVTLETYAIDEEGITWCTGPKNSMVVRVLDDLSKAAPVAVQPGPSSRRF